MDSASFRCIRFIWPKNKLEWIPIDGQKPVPCIITYKPNITAGAAINWTERKLIAIGWGSSVNSEETWDWVPKFNHGSFRLTRNSDPLIILKRAFEPNGDSAFRKIKDSDHGFNNPWLPWIGLEGRLNNREGKFRFQLWLVQFHRRFQKCLAL